MAGTPNTAEPFVPDTRNLTELRAASADCQGCGLYRNATQTVFGAGKAKARLMMIGEQPGDIEDRKGAPFVGPAGGLLDRALDDSGIVRDEVYLTNAVKHFKFVPAERGKRRIHKKPSGSEITACKPWLLAELNAVRPDLLVLLGATAAKAVLGESFLVTKHRGELLEPPEDYEEYVRQALATMHPSSVLRSRDRDDAYQALVDDLRVAADALNGR